MGVGGKGQKTGRKNILREKNEGGEDMRQC